MNKSKKRVRAKGLSDLLIGQFLLAVLLYFSVAFYESSRNMTLVVTLMLLLGVLYFSWKGMRVLWLKKG